MMPPSLPDTAKFVSREGLPDHWQDDERPTRRVIEAARSAMLVLVALLWGAVGATTLLAQETPLRSSFDMRVPVAPTPVSVEGTPSLVYELHFTNFAREPLALCGVHVLDPDEGTVLANLRGGEINRRLGRPGRESADSGAAAIAPGTVAVLYLEIRLEESGTPAALEHRVLYHGVEEDPRRPSRLRDARVRVRDGPLLTLAPPLRGGPWAAIYDPSWERGHRRVIYAVDGRARIPGRFAVDWFRLDSEGRLAEGVEDTVSNWHGYGADVLAVADAVVATVRDGVPESPTLSEHPVPPLGDATGNYVTLDLGDGRYAVYEHLRPGSVRVEPGERVTRGQVIGEVGFTGSSAGPHLHLHVADAESPLDAEGMPFVLEGFDVLGVYDDFDAFGNAPWTTFDDATEPRRTEQFPASNVIVDFGTGEP